MAEGSLNALRSNLELSSTPKIWGMERFRYCDRAAERRERISKLDIAGRARCLVWGPYEVLGPGRWEATISFTMDHWASRHTYAMEFGHIDNYSRLEFVPGREGHYEIDIGFDAVHPAKTEIRFILNQSSLGGTVDFLGARVSNP